MSVQDNSPIDLVEELTGLSQEVWLEKPIPLDPTLVKFYEKKGYNVCPACGSDRNNPPLTGCPKGSHYGNYCLSLGGSIG